VAEVVEEVVLVARLSGWMMLWKTWKCPMMKRRIQRLRLQRKEKHPRWNGGHVAQQVNLLESSTMLSSGVSSVKEQEKKRPRKNGGGNDDTDNSIIRSVLSFEESDWAQ